MSTRCEKAVEALAAGGTLRRWKALRHAARCPSCSAARDEMRGIAEALSEAFPLSAAQRRLWISAVAESSEEPLRSRRFLPVPAGALAAVILVAFGVWWSFRPRDLRVGPPEIAAVESSTAKDEGDREVEGLRGDVLALSHELDELRRRAELLDVRKDVDALLTRLGPRREPNGF